MASMARLEGANLRARIFIAVFTVGCLASLAYVFLRPAVYVSTARVQMEAPRNQTGKGESGAAPNLLTATQALTSSTVLESVVQQAQRSHPGAFDSIEALRRALTATPVPGTNVIQLQVEGSQPAALPPILESWIETYRQGQTIANDQLSVAALDEARSTAEQLKSALTAKRGEMDEFRRKSGIVSQERDENQATARLRALNTALNEARNREVSAETRLNAMREALAAGKKVEGPADKAQLFDLQRRASDARERMREMEQKFTPHYLSFDSNYQSLRANLSRIEQQIERLQQSGSENALQAVQQELATARGAVQRLQQDLAVGKREVQDFTSRLTEHSALANELRRLEESHGSATQRLAQLENERKPGGPKITVMSLPSVPDRPVRPDYWRDALIAVAGAGLLALIAVWFIEFLMRPAMPQPVPMAPPVIHISLAPPGTSPEMAALPVYNAPFLRLPEPGAVSQLPRELSAPEVGALWAAASPDAKLVIAGLFGGMTTEELAQLRCESIDFEDERVYFGGSNRSAPLREPMKRLLQERQAKRTAGLALTDAHGAALGLADLEGLISLTACDAGLANPGEVNAAVLRHTYLAYLVRQGARLADLGDIVGYVAPAAFREYGRLSPSGPGLPLAQIDPVFPTLRKVVA